MKECSYKGLIGDYYSEVELVRLTQSLIKIPSHVNHPGREKDIGLFLAKYCEEQGFSIHTKVIEGERVNVVVTLQGSGGGRTL